MNFYSIAKRFLGLKSKRVKLLSLACAHILGIRYLGIFLDPVMACNVRCKMCYFSDDSSRPAPLKPMTSEMIEKISKKLFRNALKLQIGCGAEPTIYKDLDRLIMAAKAAKVPYIEITTNAQLVDYQYLKRLVDVGLGGITLSLHGITPDTYQYFMGNAKYENLLRAIDSVSKIQAEHPNFIFRINYTFNNANIDELSGIWDLFKDVKINVLQIRPIQNIGSKMYTDFDLTRIVDNYDTLIQPIAETAKVKGVTYIGPSKANLLEVNKQQDSDEDMIVDMTYCYVSSASCYRDFDLDKDTLRKYHRRKKTLSRLAKKIFLPNKKRNVAVERTKKINYKIT